MKQQSLVQSPLALGRALRDARRRRRLTQSQAAELAGIEQPTLSKVERGLASVSFHTLLRILAALRLELLVSAKSSESQGSPWSEKV